MKKTVFAMLLALCALAFSQEFRKPTITVKELPPEAFPAGSCTEGMSGDLGIESANGKEETRLTDAQIGEYVRARLSSGYSVSIYPQISGKMFAIADCVSPAK